MKKYAFVLLLLLITKGVIAQNQHDIDRLKSFALPNNKVYVFAYITDYPNPSSEKNLGEQIPDSILTFKSIDLLVSNNPNIDDAKSSLSQSEVDSIWMLDDLVLSMDDFSFLTEMEDYDGLFPAYYKSTKLDDAIEGIKNGDFDQKYGTLDFWVKQDVGEISNIRISIKPEIRGPIGNDASSFFLGLNVLNEVSDQALKLDRYGKFQQNTGEGKYEIFYPICGIVGSQEYLVDYSNKSGLLRNELFPKNDREYFYLRLDYSEQLSNYLNLEKKYNSYSIVEKSNSPTRLSSFGYSIPEHINNLVYRNMALMTVKTLIYQNDLKIQKRLEEENRNRELKPLYDKYGKVYVDAALRGEVKVGMHIDLFEHALMGWIKINQSEYSNSYVMHYKYIISTDNRLKLWISKSSNKVTSVSYYNN